MKSVLLVRYDLDAATIGAYLQEFGGAQCGSTVTRIG